MTAERGSIEIHSENIFPIIKKWLYSDQDIFVRELVANGCDAITKLKKLISLGELELDEPDYAITVHCDEEKGTLSFTDNGIGMTADEVRRYINQVAFSSAEEFLAQYKSESGGIIGHFGLGFYSAFMVADEVEIETLSWQSDAQPVRWRCDGSTDYTLESGSRTQRGSTIILHIQEEHKQYLHRHTMEDILLKYCAFMPYPIFLTSAEEADKPADAKQGEEAAPAAPTPVNDTHPLWLKPPQDCTDEQYRAFYHQVFHDYADPILWIHLNIDYPFQLRGILYFPQLSRTMESMEGQIKLYNNQVFVADNIKEIIPEYLMMLKGVIDCPDLPLNVSRSFLQHDRSVQRIPSHITRKVADRLVALAKNERDSYEKFWPDIHPFVKFGCMRDEQFYDRVCDFLLFKQEDDGYSTLADLLPDKTQGEDDKAAEPRKVYYTNEPLRQQGAIALYREAGLPVYVLDNGIDPHFMSFIEMKQSSLRFVRVDAETPDSLKGEGEAAEEDRALLEAAFRKAVGNDTLKVALQPLKGSTPPATLRLDEFMRRYQEMNRMGADGAAARGFIAAQAELVLNPSSPVIAAITAAERQQALSADAEVCRQVYDLARLAAGMMEPAEVGIFIDRSQQLLSRMMAGVQ